MRHPVSTPRSAGRCRWPLTTVHDLAAREESGALRRVAAALVREAERTRERAAAAAALALARSAVGNAADRLREGGARAGALADAARHLAHAAVEMERLKQELRVAAAAEADASREVRSRREALAVARKAVEALERHRERWRAAERRRRGRAEEAAVDDLVSARPRAAR